MQHHGYSSGLSGTRRRYDIYDSLNDGRGEGEPLSEYEREEVVAVFGIQIAGRNLEIKGRNNFVNFVGISAAADARSKSLTLARQRKKKHPRVQQNGVVHRPDVFEHELYKQRLQRTTTEVLVTNDPLRLRVEVKVAPECPLEVGFPDPQLDREYLGEFGDAEAPAPESGRKHDVSPLRGKVDVLVVFLLKVVGRLVICECIRLLRRGILLPCKSALALLAPTEVVLHALSGKETAHDCVRLLDELRDVMMRLHRRLLEFRHEAIQLVDDEYGTQAIDPRLTQDGHRLSES
jgi:hypothetical protein